MVIPSISPRIEFRPISVRSGHSGKIRPISAEIHFSAGMNFGFLFSLLELNRCTVAPTLSLISHYLTLSTLTEKLKIKLKQKWCDFTDLLKKKLKKKKEIKEERIRGERAQAWNEEERLKSAIIMKDRNCIWARVLVTWVGWELGKSSQ